MAIPADRKLEGVPEWMVSYADMITIILAFFVIMYSLAPAKEEKDKAMQSIAYRFGPQWRPWKVQPAPIKKPRTASPTIKPEQDLDGPKAGPPNIPGKGLRAGLGGSVYFEEFATDLAPPQVARLQRIAGECAGKAQKIEVLGHASARPLPPGCPLRDHWDLAYARSHHVMDRLVALGLPRDRIRLGVAGATEPSRPHGSETWEQVNSRVDVYLLDVYVTEFQPTTP
jgi:chemotaxis protein MotB